MNVYSDYWNNHTLNVGPRTAVTDLSEVHYTAHFRKLLEQIGPEKVKRHLDYGCGAGLLAPLIWERWPDAVYEGCDISQELVDYCRSAYPEIRFYHLPEDPPQGEYDLITCHSVFTHISIEDAEKLMDELYLLLTKDGTASVSILTITDEDYSGSVPARIDINPAFFRRLLEKHGFKIGKEVDRYQRYFAIHK